jgi:putative transposase
MVHLFYQSSDERFTPIHLPQDEGVSNQQANTLQQVTTRLANTKAVIVIEDLSVAGLLTNHHLAQALADVGFAEFRRHLLYKAAWYGSQVVLAARWEPSSRTCSTCGWYDADLELADRMFRCQKADCGQRIDRDLNAAINLSKLAGSSPAVRRRVGGASAGWGREALVKLTAVKQEPNTFCASA